MLAPLNPKSRPKSFAELFSFFFFSEIYSSEPLATPVRFAPNFDQQLYKLKHFSSQRSFEYLRLTSLGVIGALVKTDENDVINFLLTTEIVPLCLNIMDNGSELSKTVATFILQKILVDSAGLDYICAVI